MHFPVNLKINLNSIVDLIQFWVNFPDFLKFFQFPARMDYIDWKAKKEINFRLNIKKGKIEKIFQTEKFLQIKSIWPKRKDFSNYVHLLETLLE